MSTIITAHVDAAGSVVGVHGGSGPMSWRRAATGSHLYGDWDGVEWVAFQPGGRAGLHTHSHTEEIWFLLRGTAEVELDGNRHQVAPGDILLTPLNSSHAVRNTGDEPLEYVVIEVFPPLIRDALPLRRPTDELPRHTAPRSTQPAAEQAAAVPGSLVNRLEENTTLAAHPSFDGSWHSFRRITIADGDAFALPGVDREHAVFVMAGTATLSVEGIDDAPIRTGSVVTVGLGATAVVSAHSATELFITTVSVSA